MNKEFLIILLLVVLTLVSSYILVSGMWWVVLWGFGFPIAFTWKSTVSVWIITIILSPTTFKGTTWKTKK